MEEGERDPKKPHPQLVVNQEKETNDDVDRLRTGPVIIRVLVDIPVALVA